VENCDRHGRGRAGNRSLLAREDAPQRIVGFLVGEQIVDELHILNVVVEPTLRRRGLGRALLRRSLEEASAAGLDVVHLEVRASNRAALSLYEGHGFQPVGVRPRYYSDGDDAVLMSLRLDVGREIGAPLSHADRSLEPGIGESGEPPADPAGQTDQGSKRGKSGH
jgi:ribosomal-protein-alanine acetyltransferase